MELDPHTLHQIVQRIEQQVRCPQCSGRVPVPIPAVRITGEDFLLLQLQCESCDAYIVLHASVQGGGKLSSLVRHPDGSNASSQLEVSPEQFMAIREALEASGGSFERLFEQTTEGTPPSA
jgi:hypothetical protein